MVGNTFAMRYKKYVCYFVGCMWKKEPRGDDGDILIVPIKKITTEYLGKASQ